jgi:hypothetical protein
LGTTSVGALYAARLLLGTCPCSVAIPIIDLNL